MVLALAAALAVPLSASAGAAPRSAHVSASDATQRFDVSGVVASVSYVSNSLALESGGQRLEIEITPTTAIEVRGESGSISDIRRGSRISASGVIRSGAWVANAIVVH